MGAMIHQISVIEQQRRAGVWHARHFPEVTPAEQLGKISEELDELADAVESGGPDEPDELADVVIAAMNLATLRGIDLGSAVDAKLSVIEQRSPDRVRRAR